ncbi:MAG: hypothetical protein IPJ77_19755 [Planctomycetes bacterium]|nr:hypothetical protein [Planctomycetota bacterium]
MSRRVPIPVPALGLLVLASALAAPVPGAQDPTPKPTPPPVEQPAGGTKPAPPGAGAQPAEVLLGSDGAPLAPGRIPANTDAAAKSAWDALLAATLGAAAERKPVTSFSLEIDVVVKEKNQAGGQYDYLAPGWVRARLDKTKNVSMRGPDGDFFYDPDKHVAQKIEVTRETESDRRQLDDMLAIARNFVALTDPKSLRIARLARMSAPPPVVGPDHALRAKELVWLDVESPDFRLVRTTTPGDRPALYRVQLGLDAKTSLPVQALVHEAGGKASVTPNTLFLELADWRLYDGTRVPKQVKTYEVDERSLAAGAGDATKLRFQLDPTSDVVITKAQINPPLTADAFRPPKK